MSVTSAQIQAKIEAKDIVNLANDLAPNPTVAHTLSAGAPLQWTPSTDPPVTEVWSDTRTIAGGGEVLSLAALPRGGGLAALDLTGLKVQAVMIKVADDAVGPVTVSSGAGANGLDLLGAGGAVDIPPKGSMLFLVPEGTADVAATDAEIDIAGTDGDDYSIIILAG